MIPIAVVEFDENGNLIRRHYSVTECAKYHGMLRASVNHRLNGYTKSPPYLMYWHEYYVLEQARYANKGNVKKIKFD